MAINCQLQALEGQGQIPGQPPGTPSTPSTSSQADTAKNVNTGSSSSRSSSAGTSTLGRNTPQQAIKSAGEALLKTQSKKQLVRL